MTYRKNLIFCLLTILLSVFGHLDAGIGRRIVFHLEFTEVWSGDSKNIDSPRLPPGGARAPLNRASRAVPGAGAGARTPASPAPGASCALPTAIWAMSTWRTRAFSQGLTWRRATAILGHLGVSKKPGVVAHACDPSTLQG